METDTMGKVVVGAKIEHLHDLFEVQKGQRAPEAVRKIEVSDALVDTGATGLGVPKRLLAGMDLLPLRDRQARTSSGVATFKIFGAVRLTVQGRDCNCDVMELPDECPVLIGQVPLELLDFVVDPGRQRLIGNPEHGGEQMMDLF
jgi:predicted aspartyl protease